MRKISEATRRFITEERANEIEQYYAMYEEEGIQGLSPMAIGLLVAANLIEDPRHDFSGPDC